MRTITKLTLAAALAMLPMSMALAECVDTKSSAGASDTVKTPPIAKDGTHAPLETQPTDTTTSNSQEKSAQKDGTTMPLGTQEGGGNKDLATSPQDVEAQQQGDKTAAAKGESNTDPCATKG
ncbi:hypothetical protein [Pseudaminobacter sp. NGMCC 1.201702]|uniref:hypothetical protein n=1 Tax=Pseudaminobacter sp. NGMCC 1.201702 TaxID=3391825 RepID=UPI0039EFA1CE